MLVNSIAYQSSWAIIGLCTEELIRIVPIALVAHHSDLDHLAALGIGNMMLMVVIQSFSYGFASGLDSLVSKSYSDGRFYSCGLHLNRALIVNTAIWIIQCIILFFLSKPVIGLLGQSDIVLEYAMGYILVMLVGMYCKVQYESIRCYLQGQKIYGLPTQILFIVSILHYFSSYLFIVKLNSGIVGAAISTSATYFISLVAIVIYISKNRYVMLHPNVWHHFNEDSVKCLGQYIMIGFPRAVLRCLDVSAFQYVVVLASFLGIMDLCTYILISASTNFVLQIALGIGSAISILITSALHSSHTKKAQRYSKMAIGIGIGIGLL